jgi:hypothetical protein
VTCAAATPGMPGPSIHARAEPSLTAPCQSEWPRHQELASVFAGNRRDGSPWLSPALVMAGAGLVSLSWWQRRQQQQW